MIFDRRHYRLSITIVVQSYNAMPLSIRKTRSHFTSKKPEIKKMPPPSGKSLSS